MTFIQSITAIFILVFSSFASFASAASWDGRIIEVKTGAWLDLQAMSEKLSRSSIIVLGEKHNTPSVQNAQARVIESVVRATGLAGSFNTAWEFLDVTSQKITADAFSQFVSGRIDGRGFLRLAQGSTGNESYIPILEATKTLGGQLIGVNLSRSEKAPVVRDGITAADPALVPPGFAMGGADYRERFTEIMSGHTPPEKLENYFAAQCLTDDVMAYHLLQNAKRLNFLVTGSFHADYFDAAVTRIKARAPTESTSTVRFIDASDYTEQELPEQLHHSRYGDIADFVFFTNEPRHP